MAHWLGGQGEKGAGVAVADTSAAEGENGRGGEGERADALVAPDSKPLAPGPWLLAPDVSKYPSSVASGSMAARSGLRSSGAMAASGGRPPSGGLARMAESLSSKPT
jgi:hypothetical protein